MDIWGQKVDGYRLCFEIRPLEGQDKADHIFAAAIIPEGCSARYSSVSTNVIHHFTITFEHGTRNIGLEMISTQKFITVFALIVLWKESDVWRKESKVSHVTKFEGDANHWSFNIKDRQNREEKNEFCSGTNKNHAWLSSRKWVAGHSLFIRHFLYRLRKVQLLGSDLKGDFIFLITTWRQSARASFAASLWPGIDVFSVFPVCFRK